MFRHRAEPQGADRLYVFVTSALPDPYVNVLIYALHHFDLSHIYFVSVAEHGYIDEDADENKRLRDIVTDVDKMLEELSDGKYKSRTKKTSIPIPPASAADYRACQAKWDLLENTSIVIPWRDLDKKLTEFARNGRAVFDVTALKKNLLVDVTVLLLSRGCERIFEFEILKERSYDDRDLIHALKEEDNATNGSYVYRNLTKTDYLTIARRRMVARSITFRNLILLTAAVGAIVLVVQILYPSSWAETVVLIASTTAAISAWLYLLRRN
jgi:hypothetical protein